MSEFELYEVPKEELPIGTKCKFILRKKNFEPPPKFGTAAAHLKILPYLEWGKDAYKPKPKWAR